MKWNEHEKYIIKALKLAEKAYNIDEVPVGAVIMKDNKIIARGYNQKECKNNCLKHAEIIAIEKACSKLQSWRLDDCIMYVTLEPCLMCKGAIKESRLKMVYYGTKSDFSELLFDNIVPVDNLEIQEKCANLLKTFFQKKRSKK